MYVCDRARTQKGETCFPRREAALGNECSLWWTGADPLREYLRLVHDWFEELPLQNPAANLGPRSRGATWTYLSTDQPFGTPFSRLLKNLLASLRR